MDRTDQTTTPIPAAYLGPIFEPGIEPVIATGFNYHPAEVALHGVETHNAIDMDLPRGTKILAPADGYYIATYGEALTRLEDGTPRRLSLAQALKSNPANQDLNPPAETSAGEVYFGSYVVQGWHTHGRYTQYAHVDWVNPIIPFYAPQVVTDEAGDPTGDLKHSGLLRATVDQYRRPGVAKFLSAGEVIAEVGMTGCGWGTRCWDRAKFDQAGHPDFRGVNYTYYTGPHLHFAVFGRRAPYTRNARLLDPFGIYGQVNAGYPQSRAVWHKRLAGARHHPLWLPQT